jgi:CBS domain-containing protein
VRHRVARARAAVPPTGTRRTLAGDGRERRDTLASCPMCGHTLAVDELAGPQLSIAARTPIRTVMSRDVFCVRRDVSEDVLAAALVERGLGGAPVVDADGRLVGFVSLTELVRDRFENGDTVEAEPVRVRSPGGGSYPLGAGFHVEELVHNTVGAIMNLAPVSLHEDAPIGRAAALMAEEGLQRIPVVDEKKRVVGMVCAPDLMRWLAEQSREDEQPAF